MLAQNALRSRPLVRRVICPPYPWSCLPVRLDESDPNRVIVLHDGVEIGFLRVGQFAGSVRVRYAERTARPVGSSGAFARAYHELMDLFGVDTIKSDVRMSSHAVGFWNRLLPEAPARKYCWRNGLLAEANYLGERDLSEEFQTELFGTVTSSLGDFEFALSRDAAYQERLASDECKTNWVWRVSAELLERVRDCDFLELLGGHGTARCAIALAENGMRHPVSFAPNTTFEAIEAITLQLPGPLYRGLCGVPEAERHALFALWVAAGLDDVYGPTDVGEEEHSPCLRLSGDE
jgi:hypothetical protein